MPESKQNNLKVIFRTLKSRNYRLYFSGQGISLIGTWIQMIALGWLVYSISHSAFILGMVGFFSRIPMFVLSPFAGVIVDRWDKYKLLMLTQVLSMIQSAILTILIFTGTIQVWHIVILSTFLGLINSLDTPVRQSFIIEIIENKNDLSNAIALNSAMFNGARLIGPSIAGILVAAVGEGWCFFINTVSFIAIIASLLFMKIQRSKIEKKNTSQFLELKEGFKYAFGFPPIKYILLLIALISIMGMPFQVLMPVFAKDIFKGGANSLGFLMASVGAGALVGALYLATKKSVLGFGKRIALAAGIFGVGLIMFAISKTYWISLVILLFVGFGMMVQMTSSNTLLQTLVDDDKRGRIMSLYTMAFMGTAPFGNFLAGSLASTIGESWTLIFGGICSILGAIYFALKLPKFRQFAMPIYIRKEIIPAINSPLERG